MYIKQTSVLLANPLVKWKENRAIREGGRRRVLPETVAKSPEFCVPPLEGGSTQEVMGGTGLGTEIVWPRGPRGRSHFSGSTARHGASSLRSCPPRLPQPQCSPFPSLYQRQTHLTTVTSRTYRVLLYPWPLSPLLCTAPPLTTARLPLRASFTNLSLKRLILSAPHVPGGSFLPKEEGPHTSKQTYN